MSSDFMELGSSGLIPMEDGRYLDKRTGNVVDPETGFVYNKEGVIIFKPKPDC